MSTLEIIAAVANIAIAFFAGVALFIAIRQVNISREVSSLSAYESYHLACLQYPAFADGRFDWRNCDCTMRSSYITFVLFALMTGERVLKLFPKDETWVFAVRDDIRIHRDVIASEHFREYRDHQDPSIRRLIDEVLSEPTGEPVGTGSSPAAPQEVLATLATVSIPDAC